jgi:hypothetical protein
LENSLEEGPECDNPQTQTKSKGFVELKIEAASGRVKGAAQRTEGFFSNIGHAERFSML